MRSADDELLRRLDSGRRADEAARSLYRAHGEELFGVAFQRLGVRGAAEEVVHEVSARAWRHAADHDAGRGSVRTWPSGIARSAIVDARRRRARRPAPGATAEHDPPGSDESIERALLGWQVQLARSRLAADHTAAGSRWPALACGEGWFVDLEAHRVDRPAVHRPGRPQQRPAVPRPLLHGPGRPVQEPRGARLDQAGRRRGATSPASSTSPA